MTGTRLKQWGPAAALILFMCVLQLIGPELLRYDTRLIQHYQWWRVLSGHWVHANWLHFVLNMSGLVLCVALTDVVWTMWQWLWRILLLTLGISSCLYLWHPQLGWYVGFSGVLFGLYVLASQATLNKQRLMSITLLCIIGIKISLEQWSSFEITSAGIIGVPVLEDAHLYGVLLAIIIIIFQYVRKMS